MIASDGTGRPDGLPANGLAAIVEIVQAGFAVLPANRISGTPRAFLDGKIGVRSAHVGADPAGCDQQQPPAIAAISKPPSSLSARLPRPAGRTSAGMASMTRI